MTTTRSLEPASIKAASLGKYFRSLAQLLTLGLYMVGILTSSIGCRVPKHGESNAEYLILLPLLPFAVLTEPGQFVESISDGIKDRRLKRFAEAIRRGDLATVKAMAKDSPDLIRCKTSEVAPVDYCPLIFAAAIAQREILEWMLDQGLAVDHRHNGKRTALMAAGSAEVAELLLARGAQVDAKVYDQNTALHMAAFQKNVGVVKVLLEHGADANARNNNGMSPLHWAVTPAWKRSDLQAAQDTIATVDLLVAKGAKIEAKDANGRTPLGCVGSNRSAITTHLQELQKQNAQPR